MTPTTVLAGDIGGTHARFARVAPGSGSVVLEQQQTYDVPGSASLEALVRQYLADHPGPVAAAAIGIAAPIVGGRANPINLPWAVDEAEVQAAIQKTISSLGATGPQDMGKVIGALKAQLAGKADMGTVSGLVKAALAK